MSWQKARCRMQIVIDIDDERYKDIQRIAEVQLGLARFQTAEQIIAKGTPLPKGHGRLFDEQDIVNGNYKIIGNRIYELEPICPSVGVDCEDCPAYEDAISRKAVLKQINCWIGSGEYRYTNATDYLTKRMQGIPPVAPQVLEQESCENVPNINDGNIYKRSCGYGWDKSKVVRHHFCPNCGRVVDNSIPCDDAVSRQAVLELVADYDLSMGQVVKGIHALPPVTPQYTEAEIQKMQDLEQAELEKAYELGKAEIQPCEDCISRQAVLDLANELKDDLPDDDHLSDMVMSHNEGVLEYQTKLSLLPPVTPQPKTGRWADDKCSACGKGIEDLIESPEWYWNESPRYCPFCGIRIQLNKAESEVQDAK